jgi:hypothetical protein
MSRAINPSWGSMTGRIGATHRCLYADPHVTIIGARTGGLNGVRCPFGHRDVQTCRDWNVSQT